MDIIECLDGIRTAVSEFQFFNETPGDYWGSLCTNDLSVHSMWAAAKVYCTSNEISGGEKLLGEYCVEYGFELTPYSTILPDLTDEYINSMEVVSFSDINETKIWNNSILLSKDFQHMAVMTTWIFNYEYILHDRYGWAVYGFWGGILLIGMLNKLFTHLYNSRRTRITIDIEGNSPSRNSLPSGSGILSPLKSAHHWVRANLVIPSSFGTRQKQLLYYFSIPTRLEGLVIFACYALNIILCSASYYVFWPNLYYTLAEQRWRYISDRCGIISYANIPWLWLFSGRNNIFLWATGWSFSTFNRFHRHVARIATVQGIIHSIGWSALETGYLSEMWKEKYWYMGGIGCITMSLLLVFSSVFLRHKSYEAFLIIHIVLSLLTIVALYYHTHLVFDSYTPYLWPPMALWAIDRIVRIVRQVYCNLHIKLWGSITGTRTTAYYSTKTNAIRLEVIPGSQILKPKPGQHYYLYQPLRWRGWENHPFTLASWTEVEDRKVKSIDPPTTNVNLLMDSLTKEITTSPTTTPLDGSSDNVSHSSSDKHIASSAGSYKLTFYIRPFDGWTRNFRDECMTSTTGAIHPRIFIEGPYGEHYPLHNYENIIFVVGGTGISGALPYIQDHLTRSCNAPPGIKTALTTRTRNITLVWAAKEPGILHDIASRELRPVLGREDVHASFYTTSPKESPSTIVNTALDTRENPGQNALEIIHGRPIVGAVIAAAIDQVQAAGSIGGRIAVLCCGPATMAADARTAVHRALRGGKREVDYFEEVFSW
ncbi:hypothetical protein B7463_g4916, partial [Scytalidium lignicola]